MSQDKVPITVPDIPFSWCRFIAADRDTDLLVAIDKEMIKRVMMAVPVELIALFTTEI